MLGVDGLRTWTVDPPFGLDVETWAPPCPTPAAPGTVETNNSWPHIAPPLPLSFHIPLLSGVTSVSVGCRRGGPTSPTTTIARRDFSRNLGHDPPGPAP